MKSQGIRDSVKYGYLLIRDRFMEHKVKKWYSIRGKVLMRQDVSLEPFLMKENRIFILKVEDYYLT